MSEALDLFRGPAPLLHDRATLVAPADRWAVGFVTRALEVALAELELVVSGQWDHAWDGQGLSAHRAGPGFTVVLHTWPELGRATLDVFVREVVAEDVVARIAVALGARVAERDRSARGAAAQTC